LTRGGISRAELLDAGTYSTTSMNVRSPSFERDGRRVVRFKHDQARR
jgi:hypothetical protein